MRAIATTYKNNRDPEHPRDWTIKIAAKRSIFRRLWRRLESADWKQIFQVSKKLTNRILS